MKHLFVQYNLAVLAKNKGFNELCLAYYNTTNDLVLDEIGAEYDLMAHEYGMAFSNSVHNNIGIIAAPLYQQLTDWFREKHNTIIIVEPLLGTNYIHIYNEKEADRSKIEEPVDDYYEALNQAIEESFKLI